MALTPGTRLGSYEIVAAIGAGGMGEVYRARDTRLNRDVALKILPDRVADDPERLARFRREARILASLNHPNIAGIHGLEESGGTTALVLELVEGPTLAERLTQARGSGLEARGLQLDEALNIARQIAAALEAAHESGIIHRDLKPANIKLRPDGTVKVLDFGLAKALEPRAGPEDPAHISQSPTLTTPAQTMQGMILGTAAYMSPEQAQGRLVDRRADVWAFGVVLYEMLTGSRMFSGDTVPDTVAAVLTREPDWNAVPARVRRVLQRCLERDLRRRWRDIADVSLLLGDAPPAPEVAQHRPRAVAGLPWMVAATMALVAAMAVWAPWRTTPLPDRPLMYFSTDLGVAAPMTAISRDGTRLAYRTMGQAGAPQLATRLLGETAETILAGTEGAINPFFSPDGQWIAYLAGGRLMKVPVQGGVPVALAEEALGRIGSWSEDGFIYAELNPFSGILRVSDQGGAPEPLTHPSQHRHTWPQVLPGGQQLLYTAGLAGLLDNGRIEILTIATGETTIVLEGGYMARYVSSSPTTGHILYVHRGVLYAVPFDLDRLEVVGESVQMLDDIAGLGASRANAFDVSSTGTLVYTPGTPPQRWPIKWLDSSGNVEPLLDTPGAYYTPRVSPDGTRLAYAVDDERGQDIHVYDMVRDVVTRLTFTSTANLWPVWAPDGEHIAFTSLTEDRAGLWWVRADGSGEPQLLLERDNPVRQIMLSADGTTLGFTEQDPETGSDLWLLPLDISDPDAPVPQEPIALIKTRSNEGVPAFSPDGRWVAYLSDELGSYNVWVQPLSGLGGRWQISNPGGGYPFWNEHGLFFLSGAVWRVDYGVEGDRFIPGRTRRWAAALVNPSPIGFETLDLAPDGQRFAFFPYVGEISEGAGHATFLLNFFDELRRRAPADR